MLASVLIAKKRDGGEHTQAEIDFLIEGYVAERIPDYQMSAWAMAVYLRGMTTEEIEFLTDAMIGSGTTLPRTSRMIRVDKHSTGGLGDKTSLILAPLLASFDLHVPMISGRGLGITGGTLDKLESIPGFRTDLSEVEIDQMLDRVGCVITGATSNIVPADKKLYALRDVTATVPSIPLITASIMSKKLAESLDALVLDVKWGSGAFMQSRQDAISLAHSLMRTGRRMGVTTKALLSDMNQPLGEMVGNALEVNESIDILRGDGPDDARLLTIELAAILLVETGTLKDMATARHQLAMRLADGSAWDRFERMVVHQGGVIDGHLPVATPFVLTSYRSGYLSSINGQLLGQAIIQLGGGRDVAGASIDPSVGIQMKARIGQEVHPKDEILIVYARSRKQFDDLVPLLNEAIHYSERSPDSSVLFELIED